MKRLSISSLVTSLIVAALVAFAVYKFKFTPVSAVTHTIARGELVAMFLGTGTLVKICVNLHQQEVLRFLLALPETQILNVSFEAEFGMELR